MNAVLLSSKNFEDSVAKDCDNCEYNRILGDRCICDCDVCDYKPMTQLVDGITECCGYNFGKQVVETVTDLINFCPVCGKKIWK